MELLRTTARVAWAFVLIPFAPLLLTDEVKKQMESEREQMHDAIGNQSFFISHQTHVGH